MKNSVFGEVSFNVGWKTCIDITLFEIVYSVEVKAKAYFERDGITIEQENAFADFKSKQNELLKMAETMLADFSRENPSKRFTPQTLLFKRDGDYALLFADNKDLDGGIALCFSSDIVIVSQDEYL